MRPREGATLSKTNVPDPACPWPSITGTYEAITTKLNKKDERGQKPQKEDRLAAIDYWMARLQEDRASIAAGGDAHTH